MAAGRMLHRSKWIRVANSDDTPPRTPPMAAAAPPATAVPPLKTPTSKVRFSGPTEGAPSPLGANATPPPSPPEQNSGEAAAVVAELTAAAGDGTSGGASGSASGSSGAVVRRPNGATALEAPDLEKGSAAALLEEPHSKRTRALWGRSARTAKTVDQLNRSLQKSHTPATQEEIDASFEANTARAASGWKGTSNVGGGGQRRGSILASLNPGNFPKPARADASELLHGVEGIVGGALGGALSGVGGALNACGLHLPSSPTWSSHSEGVSESQLADWERLAESGRPLVAIIKVINKVDLKTDRAGLPFDDVEDVTVTPSLNQPTLPLSSERSPQEAPFVLPPSHHLHHPHHTRLMPPDAA